jgi:glycosyltransferase involved in cell wall biosynthesis
VRGAAAAGAVVRALTVAIDARELDAGGQGTGVARYVGCLLQALPAIDGITVRAIRRTGPRAIGPHALMALRMRLLGADLVHGPANGLPLLRYGLPGVVTIHDLAIYEHPEWFPEDQWWSTRWLVPHAARSARVVIVPSQATRGAAIDHLGIPPDRCRVIPHGVEPDFALPGDATRIAALRQRFNLPPRFLLQVGTVQPRKNYVATINALARIPEADRIPLVVAGAFGWKYEPVVRAVDELGLRNHVRFVGYVETRDLPALYQAAEVVVFPSYDEGFGLPVLEAFAAGVPLVAARTGAIPEVAGDAAILVDPDDHAALADAVLSLLHDAALRERQVSAGRVRALAFTWAASANAHAAAYRAALT